MRLYKEKYALIARHLFKKYFSWLVKLKPKRCTLIVRSLKRIVLWYLLWIIKIGFTAMSCALWQYPPTLKTFSVGWFHRKSIKVIWYNLISCKESVKAQEASNFCIKKSTSVCISVTFIFKQYLGIVIENVSDFMLCKLFQLWNSENFGIDIKR